MTGPGLSRREQSTRAVADADDAPSVSSDTAPETAGVPTDRETDQDATSPVRADIARAGPAVTMVSLAGVVDLDSAHVLAAAMADAVSTGGAGGRVVLELNRVTFLDACGLGVILAAHADASRRGGEVVLVVDQVAPAALGLELLPLGRGPDVYPTLTTALTPAAPAAVSGSRPHPPHDGRRR